MNEFSKSKNWILVSKESLTEPKTSMNEVEGRFFDTRSASMRSENEFIALRNAIFALLNSLIGAKDSLNHSEMSFDDR